MSDRAREYFRGEYGSIILGDSLEVLSTIEEASADLVMTSPPFGLVRKKDYGNADAPDYVDWFRPFGEAARRVLKDSGSLVVDIGGAWNPGVPTRSLYHYKLLISLVEDIGFSLAQEFYWWNPSKLPTPAEWVTVRRIRVKDAVNCVWWLSKTPWPKASNRRVLQPYSDSMRDLLRNGYRPKRRPSGHEISGNFSRDRGAAIPPNLIALANTDSNGHYLRYCRDNGIQPHPARFPRELPELFIRMLTDPGDHVIDPFAGSCVTGEACDSLRRNWMCIELNEEYVRGALGRFPVSTPPAEPRLMEVPPEEAAAAVYYKVPRPGVLWNGIDGPPLAPDGGRSRTKARGAHDGGA